MTPQPISGFASYVRESSKQIVNTLQEYRLINPISRELDEVVVEQFLAQPPSERGREIGYLIDVAPTLGTIYEYLGEFDKSQVYYQLGTNKWPHPWPQHPNNRGDDSFGLRNTLGRAQLLAAICADRVGENQRATTLYEWAAQYRTLKPEELDYFAQTKQYQTVWERLPYRAYALVCLEKWDEALAVAEECQLFVEKDRRAQTTESYQSPLKTLAVVLALARYKVSPNPENNRRAQELLQPQAVASRNHSNHIDGLFYLYNLRARHPELLEPPVPGVGWAKPLPSTPVILAHPDTITALAFSSTSRVMAAGLTDGQVWLWRVDDWEKQGQFNAHPNAVRSLAFSPDGHLLATGANRAYETEEPTLRLWQAESNQLLHDFKGHTDSVTGLAFTKEQRLLISASNDRTVRLWEIEKGFEQEQWQTEGMLSGLALFHGDDQIALGEAGFHGRVLLWNLKNGKKSILEEHKESLCLDDEEPWPEHDVTGLAISSDASLLAAGGFDGNVLIFQLGSKKKPRICEAHEPGTVLVAFTQDTETLISAGLDNTVSAWSARDGGQLWNYNTKEEITSLTLSPDGKWLAIGLKDGRVEVHARPK